MKSIVGDKAFPAILFGNTRINSGENMKYKNLKLRVILPSILIVIIAVMVVAFFTGGLEAGAISKDNINLHTFINLAKEVKEVIK